LLAALSVVCPVNAWAQVEGGAEGFLVGGPALGGVSKKAAKRLEKRYAELGQGSADEESTAES
jgi:hypothetical protein